MTHRSIMLALILALPSVAQAQQSYSVDADFVRPSFGNDGFHGLDVATARKPFTFRFGANVMYTRNPVTLWNRLDDFEIGAVVTDRFGVMAGASFDISRRFTINALVPVAYNLGGEDGEPAQFEAPGIGMQDIGLGARITAIRSDNFNLGIKAGLIFPTGRSQAYLGDLGFRPHGGLLASVHFGGTTLAGDFQVVGRPQKLETKEDFVIGSELNLNFGLRQKLPAATRLGFTASVLTKAGFEKFLQGGGENGLEALGGIEIYPSKHVMLNLAGGRGITEGYGTTDLRIIGGLQVEIVPKESISVVPPPPLPPVPPPPPPPIDPPVEEPKLDTPIIVVTDESIEVKQKIEFIVNTTTLMGESRPILREVANYLNGKLPLADGVEQWSDDDPNRASWRVAHLEVVGHASEEGSYEYNYNLSQGRARTVWQTLIEMGVHPDRISHKGMGEVVPRDASKLGRELTEEELQDNRRVEFHIIKQYDVLEESPFDGMQSTVKAPWSGNVIRVVIPEQPPPPSDENSLEDDTDEFEEPFSLDDIDDGFDEEPAPEEGTDGGEQ